MRPLDLPRLLPVLLLAGLAGPAQAALRLARARERMSCHTVERKVIGPSFRDIAVRYKDQKGAADQLAGKILRGGAGVWGAVPMPANTQVSEADARKLASWVLQTH